MKKIHTLAHIRTMRMTKSYRTCVNQTGKSQILTDFGRIYSEEYQRLNSLNQTSHKQRIFLRRGL
jgi:hypothetical protein